MVKEYLEKSFFGGSHMISTVFSVTLLTKSPAEGFGVSGTKYVTNFAPFSLYIPTTQETFTRYSVSPPKRLFK